MLVEIIRNDYNAKNVIRFQSESEVFAILAELLFNFFVGFKSFSKGIFRFFVAVGFCCSVSKICISLVWVHISSSVSLRSTTIG